MLLYPETFCILRYCWIDPVYFLITIIEYREFYTNTNAVSTGCYLNFTAFLAIFFIVFFLPYESRKMPTVFSIIESVIFFQQHFVHEIYLSVLKYNIYNSCSSELYLRIKNNSCQNVCAVIRYKPRTENVCTYCFLKILRRVFKEKVVAFIPMLNIFICNTYRNHTLSSRNDNIVWIRTLLNECQLFTFYF